MSQHIRFDWAMKRLLRNKANFDILEGFLSVLLVQSIKINQILESETNQENESNKFNKVDILVENHKKELILIEVQNESERDYFHRMNFGQGKLLTDHLQLGEPYENIKKIYSINIVYFDLGQGEDYLYHGRTEFKGMRLGDTLQLNNLQKKVYSIEKVSDIFTEYFLIKVNKFNDLAKDDLDEWIYFLKNNEIKSEFKAQGLQQAKEKLRIDNLSRDEKIRYNDYIKSRRILDNELQTALQEGEMAAEKKYMPLINEAKQREEAAKRLAEKERLEKEDAKQREAEAKLREEEAIKLASEAQARMKASILRLYAKGNSPEEIADMLGLALEEVNKIIRHK